MYAFRITIMVAFFFCCCCHSVVYFPFTLVNAFLASGVYLSFTHVYVYVYVYVDLTQTCVFPPFNCGWAFVLEWSSMNEA